MENQNTNPFEPVSPEQNNANMPEFGTVHGSKKTGKLIAMIVAILAIAGSASGYFIYTLRNSAELPPSLEAVTGTGFIAGARDIGFSYETADATLINAKTGATTSRGKENEYFYAETDMSFYDVMMNIKADDFDTFKAQVIHYNTEDNLFYLFPGGVFKGLPGTSELRLKNSGDKYAELKNYTIPAFSPFIIFTNADFETFNTTAGTVTTKTFQIKSVTQSPSTYDYDVNDRAAGWHLSVLTKAMAVDAGSKCPNGIEGVWVYNPEEEDPKKMFGTSPISPSSISSTPSSYLMWINKKVAKNACRVAATQGANSGSGNSQNGSAQGGTGGTSANTEQQTQPTTGAQQSAPRVVKVTSTSLNGWYNEGDVLNIAVHFDKPVVVTYTGSNKPSLTLKVKDTGSSNTYSAIYKEGSGNDYLFFEYVVGEGHNTADLNYASISALALNGATIKDESDTTLNAILTLPALTNEFSLAGQKDLVIDTTSPTAPQVEEIAVDISRLGDTKYIVSGLAEANSLVTTTLSFIGEKVRATPITKTQQLSPTETKFSIEFISSLRNPLFTGTPTSVKAEVTVSDIAGNESTEVFKELTLQRSLESFRTERTPLNSEGETEYKVFSITANGTILNFILESFKSKGLEEGINYSPKLVSEELDISNMDVEFCVGSVYFEDFNSAIQEVNNILTTNGKEIIVPSETLRETDCSDFNVPENVEILNLKKFM